MKNLENENGRVSLPVEGKVQPKRAYSTPKLTVHGTLREITRNVGVGFVDFPNGSSIAG